MENKFLKSSTILIIGEVLTKFLGILYLIPLYKISPELGSIMADLFVPYSFMLIIAAIGINSVMTSEVGKYYNEDEKKLKIALINGLNFTFLMGLLSSILLFFLAVPLMKVTSPDNIYFSQLVDGAKILSLAIFLFSISNYMRAVLMGIGQFKIVSISFLTEQIVKIVLILLGVYVVLVLQHDTLGATTYIMAWATVISIGTTLAIYFVIFIKKKYIYFYRNLRNYCSKKEFIYLAGTGIIFFVNGIFITAFDQIDILLIHTAGEVYGLASTQIETIKGIYFNWSEKLVMIPISLSSAFLTAMIHQYQTTKSDKEKEVSQILRTVFIYCLLATSAFLIFGDYIYTILYSKSQLGITILRIESLIITFYVMRTLLSVYIVLNDRKISVFINNLILLSLKILLDVLFIFFFVNYLAFYTFVLATIISLTVSTIILIYNNRDLFSFLQKDLNYYILVIIKIIILIFIEYLLLRVIDINFVVNLLLIGFSYLILLILLFKKELMNIIHYSRG